MRVAFFHDDETRQRVLAEAFLRGAARHGHEVASVSVEGTAAVGKYDVVVIVGLKHQEIFHAHRKRGGHVVFVDKGYTRGNGRSEIKKWEYWRVSVDSHHPTERLMRRSFPDDRWKRLGLDLKPWRVRGSHVVIAGSSPLYHKFYGLKNPTTWGKAVVRGIRSRCDRPIVYRPKPGWDGAPGLVKARYAAHPETIYETLEDAWALVTHGSNACFEAVLLGIPTIILGSGVTKPISSTSLSDLGAPKFAHEHDRRQLLHALAHFQYTEREFASGLAWDLIAEELHG